MLLAYLDESYSKDWYYMAAMICKGSGVLAIGSALDEVVAKAVRGMDCAGQRRHYPQLSPHSIVLLHLLERINEYARDRDELLLVIADEVGEQARHRADLAMYRIRGAWG